MICKNWEHDRSWLTRAEAEAARALEIAPRLPEAFRARGHLAMHQRRPDLALADYHQSADLDPRYASALINLSMAYLVCDDIGRCEVYARRAHEADPLFVVPCLNLALTTRLQGRLDESREWSRRALARESSRSNRLHGFGALLLCEVTERNADGVRDLLTPLEEYADDPEASALLALAAATLGHPEAARARLDSASLIHSENTLVLLSAARAWALLGELERARAALERSFRIDMVDVATERRDPLIAPLLEDPRFDELRSFAGGMRK